MLNCSCHTCLLAVDFYLSVGATLPLIFKKFKSNFAEIWRTDEPGSVVV